MIQKPTVLTLFQNGYFFSIFFWWYLEMGHSPVFAEVAVQLPSVVPGQNGKVDLALSSVSAHLQNRRQHVSMRSS